MMKRLRDKEKFRYLYLVSDVADAPFVQDGTRDGEHIREWMHNRFIEQLEYGKRDYHILSGDYEKRRVEAIRIIDSKLRL